VSDDDRALATKIVLVSDSRTETVDRIADALHQARQDGWREARAYYAKALGEMGESGHVGYRAGLVYASVLMDRGEL
jgi:hypothetical protein